MGFKCFLFVFLFCGNGFPEQKGILYIAVQLSLVNQIGKIGTNRASNEDRLAIIQR